jgi:hypothetical protein
MGCSGLAYPPWESKKWTVFGDGSDACRDDILLEIDGQMAV